MKVIRIPSTSITISVSNAKEMYSMFIRLHPWYDLEIDGHVYPADSYSSYTRGYFKKMFGEK